MRSAITRSNRISARGALCVLFTAAAITSLLSGCVAAEDGTETRPVVENAKRVFASSQIQNGDLGGLTGADAKCGTWAEAAGLDGTWKAFLSTSGANGVNAIDRIAQVGPWYNVTRKTKIFNNKTGFSVGALAGIPTEYNTAASGDAWTATLANGNANGTQNCGNWTIGTASAYGSVGTPTSNLDNGARWMHAEVNAPSCVTTLRVYCFEQ